MRLSRRGFMAALLTGSAAAALDAKLAGLHRLLPGQRADDRLPLCELYGEHGDLLGSVVAQRRTSRERADLFLRDRQEDLYLAHFPAGTGTGAIAECHLVLPPELANGQPRRVQYLTETPGGLLCKAPGDSLAVRYSVTFQLGSITHRDDRDLDEILQAGVYSREEVARAFQVDVAALEQTPRPVFAVLDELHVRRGHAGSIGTVWAGS